MDERSTTPPGDPAPAPAAMQPSTDASKRPAAAPVAVRKDDSNVKETVESILVAFILAFIFRAFIVEAFVIPTGSMAPTLLGAHLRWACDDCGYTFNTNYSARQNDAEGNPIIPAKTGPVPGQDPRTGRPALVPNVHDVRCPNCGYDIPRPQAQNVPVHYGDRILVLKYLYLFEGPKRWDVVVFKSPFDVPRYQQNYIKRLVGLPNESVLILDGDVYVAPAGAESLDAFQIQPKPKHVQDALWRVVYDNDYHPRGLSRGRNWQQPWTLGAGSGWELGSRMTGAEPRIFRFDNASSGGTIYFDRDANPSNNAFSDWLAYDVEEDRRWTPSVVGDLKVQFDYTRLSGDGPLRVRLSKGGDTFIAELTPTAAKLFRLTGDGGGDGDGAETELATAAFDGGGRVTRIEFENVDHRVTLRVNGDVLLQTTPQQYQPDLNALLEQFKEQANPPLPRVEIFAAQQTSHISHVGVWRDVYYLNRDRRHNSSAPIWASPNDFPENVIHLGPDEYFVLGDNSMMSLDARMWSEDIELADLHVQSGRVPERFMLGKAFFVYWPAGYKPIPADRVPAITPNFGDVRFIR